MFKIGEFSKLTQVPASTLRYYDEIGLFKPENTGHESGYRYYRATQIPKLNRVVALKELGLNLEQIQAILSQELDVEMFKGMLVLKQAELEQQLEEGQARLQRIHARISQLKLDDLETSAKIELKSISQLDYLSLKAVVSGFQEAIKLMGNITQVVKQSIPSKKIGHFVAILIQDCYESENIELQLGYLVNDWEYSDLPKVQNYELAVEHLPGYETVLSAIHIGLPSESFLTRSGIAAWLEKSDYEMAGDSREVFLSLPNPRKLNEAIIELQYPIKKKINN